MDGISREKSRGKFFRKALAFVVVTFVVAFIGAVIGLFLGSAVVGGIFGALIGFWGCLRSGHVMDEPNVVKPPL